MRRSARQQRAGLRQRHDGRDAARSLEPRARSRRLAAGQPGAAAQARMVSDAGRHPDGSCGDAAGAPGTPPSTRRLTGPLRTTSSCCCLPGRRRREVAGLRWDEIDFADKVIRLPATRVRPDASSTCRCLVSSVTCWWRAGRSATTTAGSSAPIAAPGTSRNQSSRWQRSRGPPGSRSARTICAGRSSPSPRGRRCLAAGAEGIGQPRPRE